MTDKQLVLSLFPDEVAADNAAVALKDSGLTHGDAIGILVDDEKGRLKEEKVGARSTATGAGVGGVLLLLGPAALGVGIVGGAAAGALHHKGLGLSDTERAHLSNELASGKAAVGALVPIDVSAAVADRLTQLGGRPESYAVSDQDLAAAASIEPSA